MSFGYVMGALVGALIPNRLFRRLQRWARSGSTLSVPSSQDRAFGFGGTKEVDVVGESFYQVTLDSLLQSTPEQDALFREARLVPKENRHDRNAVAVIIDGRMVGHLNRYYAKKYRLTLGEAESTVEACIVRGGWLTSDGRPAFHSAKIWI